jgi:hypothetical protein
MTLSVLGRITVAMKMPLPDMPIIAAVKNVPAAACSPGPLRKIMASAPAISPVTAQQICTNNIGDIDI